jgi:tetratricopeptide (TPR) repeat protein
MRKAIILLVVILLAQQSTILAQEMNLLPKYGLLPKSEALKKSDEVFIKTMDQIYKGNRKKAAKDLSARGWQFLQQDDPEDAMRRFNQAWLLDNSNGPAVWGMAAIEADQGKFDESLKLFAEAEAHVGNDINFATDYAKALAMKLLNDAFARFARVYEKAPRYTLNLVHWAFALYNAGNYAEAWKKVKLIEAAPGGAKLDPQFVDNLKSKMPRP